MKKTPIHFIELIKSIFKKTFVLKGREPKESFLFYIFFVIVAENLILLLSGLLKIKFGYQIIASLFLIAPLFSLCVRRLHDHNKNLCFTSSPFILFLIFLPFINFNAFNQEINQHIKLFSGGIFIEIIFILFIIQSFLFIIFLFISGNKNENMYGNPINYQINFPQTKKLILFLTFTFSSILLLLLFNFIQKENTKSIKTPQQVIFQSSPKHSSSDKKQENKVIFRKIYPLPDQTQTHINMNDSDLDETSIQNESSVNDILKFLFYASLQSLAEEKEISVVNKPTPKDIIFIKAVNGDVLFMIKNENILNKIKKQKINCRKEICIFKHVEYLNNND